MRKLAKPTEDAKTVFLNCISAIDDIDLKRRLTNCADLIENEEENFKDKIKVNELYTLPQTKSRKKTKSFRVIDGWVTVDEMKNVYSNQFVPAGSPGRQLYDKILFQPLNSKCPFCFHRLVSTVDHYLPKAYYPLLSVVPINLVASCKDCNTGKLADRPTCSTEEILHPYYDNVEDDLWLKARVQHTIPATVDFFVNSPDFWTTNLQERVKFHFKVLDLNDLYSTESATELINIKHQLQEQFDSGGSNAVKIHLQDAAQSRRRAYLNSWQTALYAALSTDSWFYSGGFRG